MLKFDLHSHTCASDGSLEPELLLQRAKQAGIDVLAITDHDTTAAISAAQKAASQCSIRLIHGVEISVTWQGLTIHILGLGVDVNHVGLQDGLLELRKFRQWRAEEIAHGLDKNDILGSLSAVKELAKGGLISRTHFARFLVENGYAKDFRQVFKHYLVKDKPGHVAGQWAALSDAVSWIVESGGQAVIAHPARYRMSLTKLRTFIEAFKEAGGVGIEVVSSSHNANEIKTMAKLAERYEMLASCGSDFHSPEQAWAQLGRIPPLPKQCRPVWETWTE